MYITCNYNIPIGTWRLHYTQVSAHFLFAQGHKCIFLFIMSSCDSTVSLMNLCAELEQCLCGYVCVCVVEASRPPPFMSDLSLCSSEPRAAARQWLRPHPERRRPDADLWWHSHHSQWGLVLLRSRRIGGQLGCERQTQRQHIRGCAGARTGYAWTWALEPWHTSRFPHGGPCLTPSPKP